MILHQVEHGSYEWLKLRAGVPTSSRFDEIVTPAKLQLSKSADGYMSWLLAEWILGRPLDKGIDAYGRPFETASSWMDRGLELEDEAIKAYELQTDTETDHVGFITSDDGLVGCSPDRLIGTDGLLELKCPAPQTQVLYMLSRGVDAAYMVQLQGQLWVSERKYVDIFSYHPELPGVRVRVERDEQYIETLSKAVRTFVDAMLAARVTLEQRYGPFVRPEPEADHSKDFITDADLDAILKAREQ